MSLTVHLNVLGKTVKYIEVFFVPMNKEVIKIDKDGTKIVETISYKINFIDSMSFMATSLTNRLDNLSGEIHKIKYKECGCPLERESVKNNLIKYKYLSYNKTYSEKRNEELK